MFPFAKKIILLKMKGKDNDKVKTLDYADLLLIEVYPSRAREGQIFF